MIKNLSSKFDDYLRVLSADELSLLRIQIAILVINRKTITFKTYKMKRSIYQTKKRFLFIISLALLILCGGSLLAQDENPNPEKDKRPVKNTFESNWLIDNQTVMVPFKGTFEMDMQHRFGVVENGFDDFYGIFAPSNIRLGFSYVPMDRLQFGFGLTKERLLWDFNAKYALLRQGRSGGSPVSVTYLVNMAVDTRKKENFLEDIDRYSYFHQIMVARKISPAVSLQVSANLSHFNFPEQAFDAEQELIGLLHSNHFSISFLGRYKFTDVHAFIINYDQPLTDHSAGELEPEPNLSFGLEMVTSAHAFQIFLGNYQSIVPQLNNTTNKNKMGDGDFVIGFNITRLWSY